MPAGVAADDLADFESGGVASGQEPSALAAIVHRYLSDSADHICVLELSTASGQDLLHPKHDSFSVGDDVFIFLTQDAQHDAVVGSLREAHWYPSVGILAKRPRHASPLHSGSVRSHPWLSALSKYPDCVMVGAYDAESWILWSPKASGFRPSLG